MTLVPRFACPGNPLSIARIASAILLLWIAQPASAQYMRITTDANLCPTANAGGPYSGLLGAAVAFDGTGSSDPDGDALTYAWDFDASNGIGVDATGPTPSHGFPSVRLFIVTLTVSDSATPSCSDADTTTVTIDPFCPATAFNGYDPIKLGSGRDWFVFVQPDYGCYRNADVVLSSIRLGYRGIWIPADVKQTASVGDKSKDGVEEIRASFSKASLRTLFPLWISRQRVTLFVEGDLVAGGRFWTPTDVDVDPTNLFSTPMLAPNPLNPSAVLTYTTSIPGFVRIDLFDVQGRLVRRLVDEVAMPAGTHQTTIDGKGSRGEKLPSGVYFVRGTSTEGEFRQIITILK